MSALLFQEISEQFTTPVPDQFILEKMPSANGTYVKVYLYVFNGYYRRVPGFSLDKTASSLNILESEVIEALRYWQDQDILSFMYDDKNDNYFISFSKPQPVTSPDDHSTARKGKDKADSDLGAPSKIIRVEQPPVYAPEEMSHYAKNAQIKSMFTKAESLLGRSGYQVRNKVFSFYDYYRLQVETVQYLIEYCTQRDIFDLRSIEKVAINWSDNRIQTLSDAKRYTGLWSVLFETLNIRDSVPNDDQFKKMNLWLNEWKMPVELLTEAASRSIGADAPFSYMDSILRKWNLSGVYDLEGVAREDEKFSSRTGLRSGNRQDARFENTPGRSSSRKNGSEFALSNDYDYEKILADHKRRLQDAYERPGLGKVKEN